MSKVLVMPAGATELVPTGKPSQGPSSHGPDPAEIERLVEKARREAVSATETRWRAEVARLREQDQKLWGNVEARFQEFMTSAEREIGEQLIRVAIRLAGAIVRREVPDQAMLEDVIRKTLSPLSDLQGAKIRMHPADAERFKATRDQRTVPSIADRLEIVPDDALEPGDVVMESRNGYFDGRLEQRLKLLEEKLRDRFRSTHDPDAST